MYLAHYAHRSWPGGASAGVIHLYGHSHGTLPGTRWSCDVGVDAWGFMPVTVAQIQAALQDHPVDEELRLDPSHRAS
jgi:calcineurin-like phosphoesterase family protein